MLQSNSIRNLFILVMVIGCKPTIIVRIGKNGFVKTRYAKNANYTPGITGAT